MYEQAIGEDRFTFVESDPNRATRSCTILIRGPNKHSVIAAITITILITITITITLIQMTQTKDAIRDGLRAVKNVLEDNALVDGAGAFEIACHQHLSKFRSSVKGMLSPNQCVHHRHHHHRLYCTGRRQLGVQAFADALLVIPKTLVANAGHDVQQSILELLDAARKDSGTIAHCNDEAYS